MAYMTQAVGASIGELSKPQTVGDGSALVLAIVTPGTALALVWVFTGGGWTRLSLTLD